MIRRGRALGTFEVGEPSAGGRSPFTAADGEIGRAVRELEDAEADLLRLATERMPDIAKKNLSTEVFLAEVRGQESTAPLRVRDALEAVRQVESRTDNLVTEINRRRGEEHRAERIAAEALEAATARAAAMDAATRKQVANDSGLSVEAKATELGRLSVALSERQGDQDQWAELLEDAEQQASAERYKTRLRQRSGIKELIEDSPLLTFPQSGEAVTRDAYEAFDAESARDATSPVLPPLARSGRLVASRAWNRRPSGPRRHYVFARCYRNLSSRREALS